MPEIVFMRRGEEVLRFHLDGSRTVVGRGESCDVVIPDADISRQAAAITLSEGVWSIEDLSGRGVSVAGLTTQKTQLKDGIDMAFGQWRARFRESASVEAGWATHIGERSRTLARAAPEPGEDIEYQVRVRQAGREQILKVETEVMTAGTDVTNDIILGDTFVSGRHVRLHKRAGGLFHVSDQRSTNGTWLGTVRVYEVDLPVPFVLRLGEAELVVEPAVRAKDQAAPFQGMLGNDLAMRALAETINRVAPSNAAIAVFGESGTGKELVARALHNRSLRKDRAFIPVNCAAFSKELIESELFGHEKGAFTGAMNARRGAFEEADGGTLFLDEIGELPLDLQSKLLRALESGEIKRVGASRPMNVDVRIVAATNRDLRAQVRDGKFREDLYFRLCVVPLHLTPLRTRKGDIPVLAQHFVRVCSPHGQDVALTPEALAKLDEHHWPGNVRELRNVIHRALLMRKGPIIEPADIHFDSAPVEEPVAGLAATPSGQTLDAMLDAYAKQVVETYLARFANNRERVAKELGVARSTLFKRLKDWGLTQGP